MINSFVDQALQWTDTPQQWQGLTILSNVPLAIFTVNGIKFSQVLTSDLNIDFASINVRFVWDLNQLTNFDFESKPMTFYYLTIEN